MGRRTEGTPRRSFKAGTALRVLRERALPRARPGGGVAKAAGSHGRRIGPRRAGAGARAAVRRRGRLRRAYETPPVRPPGRPSGGPDPGGRLLSDSLSQVGYMLRAPFIRFL
ncbi:hypothetical protein GCM10010420_40200 [Streptomyces glaucosporus]|uniref:Uncharacterized protein n=1 Tax=Streptomyces glaucosporus TaxID=284044 RepID=A0ABP5VNP2_9ACTN